MEPTHFRSGVRRRSAVEMFRCAGDTVPRARDCVRAYTFVTNQIVSNWTLRQNVENAQPRGNRANHARARVTSVTQVTTGVSAAARDLQR